MKKKRGPRWYPSKQSVCVSYQHDAHLYRRPYLLQSGGERGGGEQTALGDEFKFVAPKVESPFDGEVSLCKKCNCIADLYAIIFISDQ